MLIDRRVSVDLSGTGELVMSLEIIVNEINVGVFKHTVSIPCDFSS